MAEHRTPYTLVQDGDGDKYLMSPPRSTSTDSLGDSSSSMEELLVEESGGAGMKEKSTFQLALLNIAWIGLSCLFVAWNIVLLPSQARSTVGDDRSGTALAAIVASGGVVTVLFTPYIGLLSDRCMSKYGRRRPFMIIGAVVICVFAMGMAIDNPHKPPEKLTRNCTAEAASGKAEEFEKHGHLPVLALLFACATIGYQLVSIPYNGLMADETPPSQRGYSSGILGLMTILGNLLGGSFGFFYQPFSVYALYAVLLVIFTATLLIVVFSQKENQLQKPPPRKSFMEVLNDYIEPLKDHDFRWVFFTRFLMQQGMATVMYFLSFFFHDVGQLPGGMRAETAVSYALLPLLTFAAGSSVVSGHYSDALGARRKVFVMGSALVMGFASACLTFVHNFYGVLVVASIFGIGFGTFVSVDFAMVLDVLPKASNRAKDLAVWHQALILPQLIATPIGGIIRDQVTQHSCGDHFDENGCKVSCGSAYVALFCVTTVYFILSGLFVTRIRKIK